ncbi:hypothetical protein I2I05_09460 [Hymenobacter sp. BT683]|uniref:Uncharacterized protein n=1 Tax=Hymenobacter jeongseonensis TaxID=2791027 RepID=A0ABS0III9_9BACT|nr:hypothetical protein [Hymenobacter jeongseonensis]
MARQFITAGFLNRSGGCLDYEALLFRKQKRAVERTDLLGEMNDFAVERK